MKGTHLILAVLLPFMGLGSCINQNSGNKEDSRSESLNNETQVKPDSVKTKKDTLKAANDSKELNLQTTESQLSYMRNSADWDRYETGILPQMAEDAPEYCGKLLNTGKRFIVVDKGKMKLFLYDPYGNIEKSYGIACARNYGTKQRKGDSRTTEGYFNAEGVYDSTNWLFTNDAGYTSPRKGQYGPRFIRVVRPIGIHGTGSPASIGHRVSHGCIRILNQNILELVKYVGAGTPIIVSPGSKDMAVNKQAGLYRPAVKTEPGDFGIQEDDQEKNSSKTSSIVKQTASTDAKTTSKTVVKQEKKEKPKSVKKETSKESVTDSPEQLTTPSKVEPTPSTSAPAAESAPSAKQAEV